MNAVGFIRLRFLLRTLILSVMVGFCAVSGYQRREPWNKTAELSGILRGSFCCRNHLLALWAAEGTFVLWDAEGGVELLRQQVPGEGYRNLESSSDGKFVLATRDDGWALFDTLAAKMIKQEKFQGVGRTGIYFSVDGSRVILCHQKTTAGNPARDQFKLVYKADKISIWNIRDQTLERDIDFESAQGFQDRFTNTQLSFDNKRLIGTGTLFTQCDMATGEIVWTMDDGSIQPWLAAGYANAAHADNLDQWCRPPSTGTARPPGYTNVDPSGATLLTQIGEHYQAWDLATGKKLCNIDTLADDSSVEGMTENYLLLTNHPQITPARYELWNLKTGARIFETPAGQLQYPMLSSDGSRLLIAETEAKAFTLWDTMSGKVISSGRPQFETQWMIDSKLWYASSAAAVVELESGLIHHLPCEMESVSDDVRYSMSLDSQEKTATVWYRHRPEERYGIFWMWELWLGLAFLVALVLGWIQNFGNARRAT